MFVINFSNISCANPNVHNQTWPRVPDPRGVRMIMTHIGRFFQGANGGVNFLYGVIRRNPNFGLNLTN